MVDGGGGSPCLLIGSENARLLYFSGHVVLQRTRSCVISSTFRNQKSYHKTSRNGNANVKH